MTFGLLVTTLRTRLIFVLKVVIALVVGVRVVHELTLLIFIHFYFIYNNEALVMF